MTHKGIPASRLPTPQTPHNLYSRHSTRTGRTMDYHNDGGASSMWTLSSNSSWGTAPPSGYFGSDLSSPQNWGTERSKTPFSNVSNISLGPTGSFGGGPLSWSSQGTTLVNGGYPSPSPSVPPYLSYPGSPLSAASTTTLVNSSVGVQAPSYLGYPTIPELPNRVHIHPFLQDGRLGIDLRRALPASVPHSCLVSAFNPSITYVEINFEGFSHWTLRIHTPHALTIWDILSHVYYHLHAADVGSNQRAAHSAVYFRDQSSSGSQSSGGKCVDALGRRTKFAGFKPTSGANAWIIQLSA